MKIEFKIGIIKHLKINKEFDLKINKVMDDSNVLNIKGYNLTNILLKSRII